MNFGGFTQRTSLLDTDLIVGYRTPVAGGELRATVGALRAVLGGGLLGAVVGLTGGGATKLDGQVTVGLTVPCVVGLSLADDWQLWKLRAKGGGEAEDGVAFVQPDDFDAVTNNVIWVRIQ